MSAVSLLNAAVTYQLDGQTAPEITLSTTSLNRIGFNEGAIVQVLFDGNRFTTHISPITGELFITPTSKIELPTSLSVITDTGITQTFQVTSCDGPGEIVLLKEAEKEKEPVVFNHFDATPSYSIATLNLLFSGLCPDGHVKRYPQPEDTLFYVPERGKATLVCVIEGPYERFLLFDLKNVSRKPLYIHPDHLKGAAKEEVVIAKPTLGPKETTRLMVIRKKEG